MSNSNESAPKPKKIYSREDIKAAIDLARESKHLMNDPITAMVVKNEGMTPDGREVEDLGNFLADREAWMIEHPEVAADMKKWLTPDNSVQHSKTWQDEGK